MKSKIFLVGMEVFPLDVLVCLGTNKEQVVNHIQKKLRYKLSEAELNELQMYGAGRTVQLANGAVVLWCDKYPRKARSVLLHEIIHTTKFIMDRLGMKYDDELHAYMCQYLNKQIYKKL